MTYRAKAAGRARRREAVKGVRYYRGVVRRERVRSAEDARWAEPPSTLLSLLEREMGMATRKLQHAMNLRLYGPYPFREDVVDILRVKP